MEPCGPPSDEGGEVSVQNAMGKWIMKGHTKKKTGQPLSKEFVPMQKRNGGACWAEKAVKRTELYWGGGGTRGGGQGGRGA